MKENLPPKIHRVFHAGGWGLKCKISSPKSSGSGYAQHKSANVPVEFPGFWNTLDSIVGPPLTFLKGEKTRKRPHKLPGKGTEETPQTRNLV